MLRGVLVVDLTTSIAGPYAAMLLGDFGADVVKVERPGPGDDARQWGPPFLDGESLWFLAVNRNKKSITLDFANPRGLRVLHELLDKADVVITNQVLRAQQKLGVDAEALRASRPKLIHVSLTGFGLTGPNSALPCYDLIAEGYSGIMDLTGASESEPQKVGAPAADMLAGTDAAMATLAALHKRQSTGEGCALDVALTESMIRFVSPRIVSYLGSGEVPRRSGGRDSVIAIYQTFDTADLPMTLGLGNDAIWRRFWDAVGLPAAAEGEAAATNASRRANRETIVEGIQAVLTTRPRHEWLEMFAKAKVPAGPIYRVDEVARDQHFLERGLFYDAGEAGALAPQVGLGIHVDGKPVGCRTSPPNLGEHNEEVLRHLLGYSDELISDLERAAII